MSGKESVLEERLWERGKDGRSACVCVFCEDRESVCSSLHVYEHLSMNESIECVCVQIRACVAREDELHSNRLTDVRVRVHVRVCVLVEVYALLWHMRVRSCLITDQALRQRQTAL